MTSLCLLLGLAVEFIGDPAPRARASPETSRAFLGDPDPMPSPAATPPRPRDEPVAESKPEAAPVRNEPPATPTREASLPPPARTTPDPPEPKPREEATSVPRSPVACPPTCACTTPDECDGVACSCRPKATAPPEPVWDPASRTYRLADAKGTVWTWPDPAWLKEVVRRKNAGDTSLVWDPRPKSTSPSTRPSNPIGVPAKP